MGSLVYRDVFSSIIWNGDKFIVIKCIVLGIGKFGECLFDVIFYRYLRWYGEEVSRGSLWDNVN